MAELSTLLAIALKTSLLLAFVGIVVAALAKASAAYRHLMWTAALALAVLMPLAILYVPAQVLIPVWWPAPETFASTTQGAAVPSSAASAAGVDWAASLWWMLFSVWTVGAAALLLRDAAAHAGLMRWRRRAHALASPRWSATLERLSHTQELPRGLVVLESSDVAAPCTWGVVRPILLLPLAGETWSETERRQALVHELAHISRHDYLSALVSRLCCAMHWYNPLVWLAAAQVRKLQEQACDDAVLREGGRPSEYAQLLVNIAEHSRGPIRVAMGMAGRSQLRGRVLAILGGSRVARVEPGAFMILGVLLALSCLMFFIATAAAAPEQKPRHWIALSAAAVAATPSPTAGTPTDGMDDTGAAGDVNSGGTTVRLASADANRDQPDDAANAEQAADGDEANAEDHGIVVDAGDGDDADEQDVDEPDADEPEADESDADEPEDADEPDEVSVDLPVVAPSVPGVPAAPVQHERRVVVRVPAIPATPAVAAMPARRIVVQVPEIPAMPPVPAMPARRIVVNVPPIPAIPSVPAMPARRIVVRIHAVEPLPAPPPRPPHPPRAPHSAPAPAALPAPPAPPAAPPDPPSPPEQAE